jgi:hypothetical protein
MQNLENNAQISSFDMPPDCEHLKPVELAGLIQQKIFYITFEVVTTVKIHVVVFWVMTQ